MRLLAINEQFGKAASSGEQYQHSVGVYFGEESWQTMLEALSIFLTNQYLTGSGGRQRIASAGYVSTRTATILAPSFRKRRSSHITSGILRGPTQLAVTVNMKIDLL